jgi:hypothetical protein
MKVTMLLADFAQVVGGKLYIMGGGWSVTGPMPSPSAIAVKIEVPWNETNRPHEFKIELMDSDYKPVLVPTPAGNAPLIIGGKFEVGRPVGAIAGAPIDAPIAVNIGPIPLPPASRFVWKLGIDGKSDDNWTLGFSTRGAGQPPMMQG